MATDTLTASTPRSATDTGPVWSVTAIGDSGQLYVGFTVAADNATIVRVSARARARYYNIPDRCALAVTLYGSDGLRFLIPGIR